MLVRNKFFQIVASTRMLRSSVRILRKFFAHRPERPNHALHSDAPSLHSGVPSRASALDAGERRR